MTFTTLQKAEILKPCPCGSGVNFETCCQPCLLGLEKAQTAEQLLRARYTAFVAGQVDYIIDTHHPEKRKELHKPSIAEWAKNSHWHGLEVVNVENGKAQDDEGTIEFVAHYTQDGRTYNHRESSLFKKLDGAWYFYDVCKNMPIKNAPKTGSNDPCPCGSGKKFKKCHGV